MERATTIENQAVENDRARRWWHRIEGPTWLVIMAVYGGWAALVAASSWIPLWLLCPVLVVWIAWHGHLQHELVHGHPTRHWWINGLIGLAPLGLIYPFSVFKRTHLAHHDVETLAMPNEDPESFYVTPEEWAAFGPIYRAVLTANNSMLGRFAFGPALTILALIRTEGSDLLTGKPRAWLEWGSHAVLVSALLYGIQTFTGLPAWLYAIAVAYPGTGLLMMRSYLEHRPAVDQGERTAVVEGNWFFSLLYLNNNFHVVHHDRPGLSWYEIPAVYAAEREVIAQRNGGYVFKSYAEVARRHLFRPKDLPVYAAS